MDIRSELDNFIDIHRNQLVAANIPEHFWLALYEKLTNEIFDAGQVFQILKCDEFEDHEPPKVLQAIADINILDTKNVFLIDHAWTFHVETAKTQLKENKALLERLCDMFALEKDCNDLVEKTFKHMWKFVNWYSINSTEDVANCLPCWYVMDELGSAVWHSDSPNCRIVPFIFMKDQSAYSILFPIKNVVNGDFISRDFAENITDQDRREAYLIPWQPKSMEDVSIVPPIPDRSYFLSGHIQETLPNMSNLLNKKNTCNILKVYSQYDLINTFLISNKFDIVETEDDADILWYTKHFKDFELLSNSPTKFVNQYPYEYILTVKDLLCIVCRRQPLSAKWIPTTYNLLTELPNFVSYFQSRDNANLENYWIVKPYNLARGLDIHISNNLDYIIRLSATGPKIVQKYITNPVLFFRSDCNGKVKFDIRYVIVIKSIKPLEAYVYKSFFLRFANKPFELNEFDIYEKHFTVMNYSANVKLKHIKCEDFLIDFKSQYPNHSWNNVETLIVKMLKDILISATSVEPPCGIAESPQSRALYAADIMLEWNVENQMEPRILEINFMPDCKRACDYYPQFFDEVFELLFQNGSSENFLVL